ncbi:uncharacterized protein LOC127789153 isoform X2 [Diospyros lotus]|uniref:uncharacterized protein LOC127789153 isoform X2 n=1 Tax=Diospyros lotus TaxID=55363 RepID=UPI0022573709|nr:uncharacterized protein LOC127789153 isoform X2 [Diospyros lotus]
MPRITTVLRQSRKAIQDLDLLKVLQSEIRCEQSLNPELDNQSGPTGDFVLDWDSPQSQDVVLRKKYESGEEVAVSALLGPEITCADSNSRRDVLMKICIKKPGLSSILQFDCGYSSEFDVHNAYYIPPSACLHSSVYKGPSFSASDCFKISSITFWMLLTRGDSIGAGFFQFVGPTIAR